MIILELALLTYCIYFVSYSLFFSVSGLFYKRQISEHSDAAFKKFAVLIPGYKEDAIVIDTIENNLKVDYPNSHFDIVVIADSFQKETLDKIDEYDVIKKEVRFEKSTKVKALSQTIKELPDNYDFVVVLDADNIMEPQFLKKVNTLMVAKDYKAVQTQRWPKNQNNNLATLDGVSESINNHIYRQGAHTAGFSVSLSGSGMIFERHIFQHLITQMESIGGFDRELEFRLLESGVKVRYFKEAVVFDQKTDNQQNFSNQRTRWISSQYVYLLKYLRKGFSALLRGDIIYFHSTVWRNIQLPRLINLGILSMLTLMAILIGQYLNFHFAIWPIIWVLFAISFAISIPRKLYNKQLLLSIIMLPKLFFSMLLILLKLKGANKKFIHTEHKPV